MSPHRRPFLAFATDHSNRSARNRPAPPQINRDRATCAGHGQLAATGDGSLEIIWQSPDMRAFLGPGCTGARAVLRGRAVASVHTAAASVRRSWTLSTFQVIGVRG